MKVFVRLPKEMIGVGPLSFSFIVDDRASFESDRYAATFDVPETMK